MNEYTTDPPLLLDDDSEQHLGQSRSPFRAVLRLALLVAAVTVIGGFLGAVFPKSPASTIGSSLALIACLLFTRHRPTFDAILTSERFRLLRGPLAVLASIQTSVRRHAAASRSQDRRAAVKALLPMQIHFPDFVGYARRAVLDLTDEATFLTFSRAVSDLQREYRSSYEAGTNERFSLLLGELLIQHIGRQAFDIIKHAPRASGGMGSHPYG